MLSQYIARGARKMRDDRDIVPDQSIEQARLAGIGPAGNDDVQSFTKYCTLARRCRNRIEVMKTDR